MGELYERILGQHATLPKIPVHGFQATAAEWARARLTGAQANTAITVMSGQPLGATGQTEAQDLVNTVTSIAVTGTAVQIADGKASRALRIQEIDQVLLLADSGIAGYSTAAGLVARLGVPTR